MGCEPSRQHPIKRLAIIPAYHSAVVRRSKATRKCRRSAFESMSVVGRKIQGVMTAILATPAPADPLPKIVVIMGAGSSADFGVPTLRSVFKDPSALAYLRRDAKLHEWLQRVFWEPRG